MLDNNNSKSNDINTAGNQNLKSKEEGSLLIAFATGLLPFVAVSTSAFNGLIAGVVLLVTLLFSSVIFNILRSFFSKNVRLPAYFIINAGVVSIINLALQAYNLQIFYTLGIYLPLMAVCVSVIGIGGGSAASENIVYTIQNATFEGAAAILVLFSVGSLKEILGKGQWFDINLSSNFPTMEIFEHPSGGFLIYGVALAVLSMSLNAFAHKQSLLTQLKEDGGQ